MGSSLRKLLIAGITPGYLDPEEPAVAPLRLVRRVTHGVLWWHHSALRGGRRRGRHIRLAFTVTVVRCALVAAAAE